jgi:hypothetical protein
MSVRRVLRERRRTFSIEAFHVKNCGGISRPRDQREARGGGQTSDGVLLEIGDAVAFMKVGSGERSRLPPRETNKTQTDYINHFALAVGSVTTVCG